MVPDIQTSFALGRARRAGRLCVPCTRGVVLVAIATLTLITAVYVSSAKPAAASIASSSNPFTVKIVGDLSGGDAVSQVAAAGAIETYFDMINASGGVDGHKISFTATDTQSTSAGGEAAIRQAVAASPTAIDLATSANDLTPMLPVLQSAKLPVVADTATDGAGFGTPASPWYYTDASTPEGYTKYLMAGLQQTLHVSTLKGKKVAFVELVDPFVQTIFSSLQAAINKQGGKVVSEQMVTYGQTSFASGAQNIVSSQANAAVQIDAANDDIVEAKGLSVAGFKGPIVSNQGGSDDVTIKQINQPTFYALKLSRDASPGTVPYEQAVKYGKQSATTNAFFGEGWGVAALTVDALKKCGYPCSGSGAFEKAANSLGTFTIPNNVFFGSQNITAKNHELLSYGQYYALDPSSGKVTAQFHEVPVN